MSDETPFEIDEDRLGKSRIYVDSPDEVPEDRQVQEGTKPGVYYYETDPDPRAPQDEEEMGSMILDEVGRDSVSERIREEQMSPDQVAGEVMSEMQIPEGFDEDEIYEYIRETAEYEEERMREDGMMPGQEPVTPEGSNRTVNDPAPGEAGPQF